MLLFLILVRIEFLNQLAESNQLWYLLEAKSACTNQVVGSWKLIKQPTTDTIYCYNRDDVKYNTQNFILFFLIFPIQLSTTKPHFL